MNTKDLCEMIDVTAESLLEEDSVYEMRATELISAEQLRERHREEIKSALRDNELKEAIEKGFDLVHQNISEVLEKDEIDPFFKELSKIKSEAINNPSSKVQDKMQSGDETITYQEVFGLSNKSLKKIYSLGYRYFERQEYEKAISVFSIVTTLNPFVFDFWNAMALSFQAKEEWEKALDTFAIACELNKNAIHARISCAECYINLKQFKEADEELFLARKIMKKKPSLKERWGAYIKSLKSQI